MLIYKLSTISPILVLFCLPVLTIGIGFIVIFRQRPDPIIQTITDSYHLSLGSLLPLSQEDEPKKDEHFLCTIALKGHYQVVKPIRYGIRGGEKILCNRQLLIANAFEELLEERFPALHKIIRQQYNKVGKQVHRHYHIFNNKFIADLVYLLMKPLEVIFILILYIFDKKPENRIGQQYLAQKDRRGLSSRK